MLSEMAQVAFAVRARWLVASSIWKTNSGTSGKVEPGSWRQFRTSG
ncbi:MAG TPA: hypothetical protein VGX71_18450 [Pseudaminobacter sp.]|nr:hypothetical protein [Pseudaminobacter sp.]